MPDPDLPTYKLLSRTNIASFGILFFSGIWLSWWFVDRSNYVYVSDARITATMISISSRIPGWVVELSVRDGTFVNAGDILAQIDPRDAALRLEELEASLRTIDAEYQRHLSKLDLTQRQVKSKYHAEESRLSAATSGASEASVAFSQAKREFARAKSLLVQEMISEEDYEGRKSNLDRAEQSYNKSFAESEIAQAELLLSEANKSELDVIRKEMQIIKSRESELRIQKARLLNTVNDHTIRSPINGVIDESFVNPGEYVYPGQRILMIHNPEKIWIKANVKETDIRHLFIGSKVNISVDAYPETEFVGKVTNIGNSATSQFALLPSPNPSGNFTKVTQRLEVQIQVDSNNGFLKPGMMVELAIHIIDKPDEIQPLATRH